MDKITKEKRSEIMSKIRSRDTRIEQIVFARLKQKGVYFQKHYTKALGQPDIALPRKKCAIFIDGDFWHGYQLLKLKKRLPKKYWIKKIENNVKRDRQNRSILRKEGWKVMRVWEHEIYDDIDKVISKIISFLENC